MTPFDHGLQGGKNLLERQVARGAEQHECVGDGLGLRRDIETNANWPLLDRRLLLLGAGGAAAGALGPLLEARPACVAVWNRSPARAAELVARQGLYARLHQLGFEAGVGA